MHILVTGGAGFIGNHFIRRMIDKHKITNLDALTYSGNLDNLRDVEKKRNYAFVKGNILNTKLVNKLAKKVDVIVNFAAETHVDRSLMNPESFLRTDVFGTHVLLEAARKHDLRYLQISTDEVYGSRSTGSFSEKDALSPTSPYSSSKAAADLLVLSYFHSYSLQAMITRSSNNYGPNQYPEKVVPLFITNALENKPLPLYGDGKNVRDWLYVKDNCTAIDLVLRKGKAGEVYNIGSGTELQNIAVTKKILKLLGKPESLIRPVRDRPGHDRRYSIKTTKIKALGWKPTHTFQAGIQETVDWYRNNPRWWRKIKSGEFLKYYKAHYKRHGL